MKLFVKELKTLKSFYLFSPDWMFKDFALEGQSNYAFNIILNEPDKNFLKNYVNLLKKMVLNIELVVLEEEIN